MSFFIGQVSEGNMAIVDISYYYCCYYYYSLIHNGLLLDAKRKSIINHKTILMQATKEGLQKRLKEIDAEIEEIRKDQRRTRITSEDIEDVSDAYQERLEQGWAIDELTEERKQLVKTIENLPYES